MDKQLLVDYTPFEVSPTQINESLTQNNGKLVVKGVLQRAEAKNQNGRVYPMETLMREAKKYAGTYNVSHNVLGMDWKGKDLVGTVEVLSTPSGNILKELFKCGIKLGISSRGMGSVKEVMRESGETLEVQPDFELIAFDFVSNPSTHGAFLSPVNESKGNISNNKFIGIERIITDIITEF